MEKKSYAFGFLSAVGLMAAIGLWLNNAPVAAEAATSEEAIDWCQSQSPWPATPDSEETLKKYLGNDDRKHHRPR